MTSRVDRGMRPRAVAIMLTSALIVLGAGAGAGASSALTFRGTAAHAAALHAAALHAGALRAAALRGAEPRARDGVPDMATWTGMSWGAVRGSVTLDGSPGVPITNPKTRTLYVPIQCGDPSTNASCNATADNFVDVINATKCRPGSGAGCTVVARATVGSEPLAATVDEATDTIYTANAPGTVSVINGATCNAHATSGCSTPVATIRVGGFLVAAALDPATHTLYVSDVNGHVFVLNVAACNAVSATGCGDPVKAINDPRDPDWVDVDVATDTVYVADDGNNENGDTVSVFNGATCNGTAGNGCGQSGHKIHSGPNPFDLVVDQATDTVYVANTSFGDGSVAVINGATCNAKVKSGCGQAPPQVPTGSDPTFLAVDGSLHTLFAINQTDDTISEIDTRFCNGTADSGCSARPLNEQATFNPPESGGSPNAFALDRRTGTAYVANVGGQSFVQAVSIRRCNAVDSSGCRLEAPSVPDSEFLTVVDRATNTIYAGNVNLPQIDVINGNTCRAGDVSGCAPVAEIPVGYAQANFRTGAIDDATHTLYSADFFGNYISVINIAHCTATDTTGCSAPAPQINVGPNPGPPVLDAKTHTLYAPYEGEAAANKVAVMDAATCNAEVTSGCGQKPASVTVAEGTELIALSTRNNTVYGAGFGPPGALSVINGATCNATDHAGCHHPAPTFGAGFEPNNIGVDDQTDTVYVPDWNDGDFPGTVSIINGATCNGTDVSGCAKPSATATVGIGPFDLEINVRTGFVYIPDLLNAEVSEINGSRCNAERPMGCAAPTREQPVGSDPGVVAVSEDTNTVYSMDEYGPTTMAVFAGARGRAGRGG
jgi:DNA-binding beta-propeller fold protein YncE